jgi:hypothetical protein
MRHCRDYDSFVITWYRQRWQRTSPSWRRQKRSCAELSLRAAEVVSIDVHLPRLRSARSTLSGLRRNQWHGDGCCDYGSASSLLPIIGQGCFGLHTQVACRAELLCSGRGLLGAGMPPIDYPHELVHELFRCFAELNGRAAAGTSRLANWIADARSMPMSRYLRWCADATTHRTHSSGWKDRSWSTYVSVPSWHALSAIRVRLTAHMYACMTRMRYVTGHSCSLGIFFGVFLNPHLR